jgi:hypothetical protein
VVYVSCMREHRNIGVFMGKPKRGDSEDLGIMRTCRWSIKEKGGMVWTRFTWLLTGTSGGQL